MTINADKYKQKAAATVRSPVSLVEDGIIGANQRTGNQAISLSQGILYSLPIALTSFLMNPTYSILPGIYARDFGLSLATIATVVLIAKLFDAVTDPLIGYYSDLYRSRKGTRKPWVLCGCLLLVVSSYYLYIPPDQVSAGYFLLWFCLVYFSWTLVEVPHMVWGGELAVDSQEKTKIYSLRVLCQFLGGLVFMLLPFMSFLGGQGFTPETLKWSVVVAGIIVIPVLLLCLKNVPDGKVVIKATKDSFSLFTGSIIGNKPFLIQTFGVFIGTAGFGMLFGVYFIFGDAYLDFGDKLPGIYALSTLFGLLAVFVMYQSAYRIEKMWCWHISMVLSALACAGYWFLVPGEDALIPFVVLTFIIFFANAVINVVLLAILSDIADYGTWKFGVERNATYFAIYLFIGKTSMGVGGALGLALAGWSDLDPTVTVHSEESLWGLRMAMSLVPAIIIIVSVCIYAMQPINTRRHSIIQRRLTSRIHQ